MKKTINQINSELKSYEYVKWNIDGLIREIDCESKDSLTQSLAKYISDDFKKISVSDEDATLIYESQSDDDHLLVKIYKDYLLACNKKTYNKSNLLVDITTFLNMYFDNASNHNGMQLHTAATVIEWLLYKYPKEKSQISDLILNRIMSGTKGDTALLYFPIYIHNMVKNIKVLNENQMSLIFDKYMKEIQPIEKDFYFYADVYKSFVDTIFKNNDNISMAKKEYCDFVIRNIEITKYQWGLTELQIIRDYMDEIGYPDSCYAIIDKKISNFGKEALSQMKKVKIEVPNDFSEKLRSKIRENESLFNKITNQDKVLLLLTKLPPVRKTDIDLYIQNEKESSFSFMENKIMSSNGIIINYKKLGEIEKYSLDSTPVFGQQVQLMFDLFINPFFLSFKYDEETNNLIIHSLENNKLVPKKDVESLCKLLSNLLNKNFKSSIFALIDYLEYLLRYYFANEGFNVKKRNKSGDYVGLSDMLSLKESNGFKSKLLDTITEDFFFNLEWLLTDNYGYNLRNKISHHLVDENECNNCFAIYLSLLIFKFINGFSS